jgi:hypothetical protein
MMAHKEVIIVAKRLPPKKFNHSGNLIVWYLSYM